MLIAVVGLLAACGNDGKNENIKPVPPIVKPEDVSADTIKIKPKDEMLNAKGVPTEAIDFMESIEFAEDIKTKSCWNETIDIISYKTVVPEGAVVINTLDKLKKISGGTLSKPKVYHVKGDFVLPSIYDSGSYDDNPKSMGIKIPNNVVIYFEGSIHKDGFFLGDIKPDDGIEEENRWDVIFNLADAQNVKMYGVNSAKVSSLGRSVAFLINGKANNIHIEGFYISKVWEALS